MQNTTADYKLEINKPSRAFESKITIGNNIYTNEDLVNLIEEYAQPQEGFAIGNTISQSLDLTLLNRGDIIYSTSQIKVEIGLKIGDKIEYIPMGIFNIDDIEKTDYTTKFTAYDNMIKFETPYFSSLGDKPTLKQVVNELCQITGVEFIGSLPDYNVSKLEGFTCREVLSYVASICGGNAFITRDGKFTIKNLGEVEKAIDGSNYFDYTREEVRYKVGQISCQVDENNILSKGSIGTDSMELGFENPWITETILTEIYNKLKGLEYLGYSMKWQGDISLDPYDIITVTDVKNVVRKIPILSQKLTYTGGLTSEIGAKGETKNKNSFSSSGSTTNKVNRLVTEQAVIKEALIEKANIKDVEAVSIRTQTLEAKTAKLEEAVIDVAYIKDLTAINANIQTLFAADATINNALIGKADIKELNAVKGTINVLESDTANIKNLLAGNISGESGQLIHLTASNVVIADAVIKDLIAANIRVEDLMASTISTTKFRIVSDSGKMLISDNTIQISDNNRVRVQIGKDASNDYNMYVWDSAGKLMFDATGLKADGIKNKIIRDDMISDTANISGSKVNISSLITEINKDTNTSVIKSSKVQLDTVGQTLEVAFTSLKSNVDNMEIGGRNLFKYSTLKSYQNQNFDSDYKTGIIKGTQNWYFENYIDFEVGAKYTISIKNIINNSTIYPNEVNCRFYDKVANKIIGEIGRLKSGKSITFEVPLTYNSNCVFLIYVSDNTKVSYELSKVKVEKGTKETDYTSAPEDTEEKIESNTTAISIAQGKIDGLISENSIIKGEVTTISDKYTSLKATVDGINTTVASHTSSIGAINTSISGLSGKVTTVENNYASLSQDLSGFKTTVANNYSTKTELSTVDGKVTGLTSRVSTAESSITQLNNQIKLKVEQTDITTAINNMQIDGRNAIVNSTGNLGNTSNWSNVVLDTSKKFEGCNSFKITRTNYVSGNPRYQGAQTIDLSRLSLQANDYITLSGWVYVDSSVALSGSSNNFSFRNYYDNSNNFEDLCIFNYGNVTKNTWVKFSVISKATKSSYKAGIVLLSIGGNGLIWVSKLKLEKGTKATGWTPAIEDVDSSIENVQTQITTTSNKVATIETNLSSITQRVSSTESTVSTHTSQLSTVDSRINTAKNSAISTAASDATSKANTAQTNAISSAKSYTDGQITTVNQTITNKVAEIKATTDSITSTVSKVEQIATSSLQGKMLFVDPTFKNGSNSIRAYNNAGNGNVVVSRVTKSSDCPTTSGYMMQITTNGTASPGHGGFYFGNTSRANAVFITKIIAKIPSGYTLNFATNGIGTGGKYEWLTSNAGTGNWKEYIFKVTCRTSGTFSTTNYYYLNGGSAPVTWYLAMATVFDITETSNIESRMETAEQKITPTAITTTISSVITGGTGSISTTQFVMDKNGLTIKNGALTIQNKAGTTVLNSDTNGNLIVTGTLKSQSGAQFVSMNSGGIDFQDWNKNEQMLRIGISYFDSNRDMNGVNFALAKYGDFIRFSHIAKADLTNGWTSSDTQYNFMDFWSGTQTVDTVTYKKGINVYAPMYVNGNGILFNNESNFTSDIRGATTWNTITDLLGIFGDNGLSLGYRNGSAYESRIVMTEGSHPGTDDKIKSWGHWNGSGYVLHNFEVRATALSVSGSKNCIQKTKNYGERLINAYETAEYYFADLGFGKINSDGECLVYIDDIFQECVNTDIEYHVFTQSYNGAIKTIERYKTYFIVKGDPGTNFSWELKAKRIGYENNRLDTQSIVDNEVESNLELFSDEDFNVKTSENTLMDIIKYSLEDLLMEG